MKTPASLFKLKEIIFHFVEKYDNYFKPTAMAKSSWALVMANLPTAASQAGSHENFTYFPELFSREFAPYQNYQSLINSTWIKIAMQNGIQPKARANVIDMRTYLDNARHTAALASVNQVVAPFKVIEEKPMPAYRVIKKTDPILPLPPSSKF